MKIKYFLPDWEDRLDPNFDFEADTLSRPRYEAFRNDQYAHEFLTEPPYDGILVSLAVYQEKVCLSRDKNGRPNIRGYQSIRGYFRLKGRSNKLKVMGDCGAFAYVNEERPPKIFNTRRVAELYHQLKFDYGVSVDHMVPDFIYTTSNEGKKEKVFLTERDKRKRVELSLRNAEAFILHHKKLGYAYIPIAAVQGTDPRSYANSLDNCLEMGYQYLGLGTLIPKSNPDVIQILEAVRKILNKLDSRKRRQIRIHLFGITRPKLLPDFERLGVTSIDSASLLRKAWLRSGQNYLTKGGKWFAAIRVPFSSNPRLIRNAKKEKITGEELRSRELTCLELLRKYQMRRVKIEKVLDALMNYDQLLLREWDGNDHLDSYKETLESRPWEKCGCEICRAIGIDVVIFRGCNRNKRRGLHNMKVFYDYVLNGKNN
jgi:hypothetical protein